MNRGAFAAVINDNGEILLVKSLTHRKFNNHWSLPGGVAEKNETLVECAIREIIEETAIHCKIKHLIMEVENKEDNINVAIFEAYYLKGSILKQANEIADAKWFKLYDAMELPLSFNTKDILRGIK
jgi:ADP-ribose pyrophosphatase YjhB (NUDIX family)